MLKTLKLINSDWRRYLEYYGKGGLESFLLVYFHNPGMWFSLVYRIQHSLMTSTKGITRALGAVTYPFYFYFTYFILDIDFSPKVPSGEGLYLHNRGIIVAEDASIGKNVNLVGPLTIGVTFGVKRAAEIGDNVRVSTGARIIGDVKIGNNSIVGANAVVTKDVPPNVIVGGVPAVVIKKIQDDPHA